MIDVKPIRIEDYLFVGITVQLPHTTLLVIANDIGYVMCGALDVDLLNEKLQDRPIIAGRAVGVKTLDDLLHARLDKITVKSEEYKWKVGMLVKDALLQIAE
ncbi:YunC family protein [Gracilibacillus dipsosauri]|uniref:DUF1805 domain-containing protein n=1 Tax=Gracilibacillus dipsosauri TaxID=178340 RepID=A0A317KZE8_9BACI|nr:DUF1805 domain-containing protein [Gracilibacillus dipsosauri]PWU68160.1 DUF1805 domain-containing protein [Gracilibacillus dipsosauri]